MKIEEQIREYIVQTLLFGDNNIRFDNDTSFLQKRVIDSIDILQLVIFVEKTFNLVIDEEEITPDNFDSVNKLAHYIRLKVPSSASPSEEQSLKKSLSPL